jgi:hypothetical protein
MATLTLPAGDTADWVLDHPALTEPDGLAGTVDRETRTVTAASAGELRAELLDMADQVLDMGAPLDESQSAGACARAIRRWADQVAA